MHLCDIPHERIHEIDIPNSLPLVYSYRKKCIQVLDDGLEEPAFIHNPLGICSCSCALNIGIYSHDCRRSHSGKYDFGESPELLFKPCDFEAENADQCFIGEGGRSYSFDPIVRLVPVLDGLVPTIDPSIAPVEPPFEEIQTAPGSIINPTTAKEAYTVQS